MNNVLDIALQQKSYYDTFRVECEIAIAQFKAHSICEYCLTNKLLCADRKLATLLKSMNG